MKFSIITAFPNSFATLQESIVKRAQTKGLVELEMIDLKNFGGGEWNKIDDKPFGGGAGMLLQIEPIYQSLVSIDVEPERKFRGKNSPQTKILLTSAKGWQWNQSFAQEFASKIEHLIIICGHYEGIDHRVSEYIIDDEVRVGPYILSGGELAAQIIVDSTVRLIPGVLGNDLSIREETQFNNKHEVVTSEYPQYTRPNKFITSKGSEWLVPDVLLSGNHKAIADWQSKQVSK